MPQQTGSAEIRGHSLIWEQKWDEALKEFEAALKEDPKNPTIHDGLATAKRELGDIKGALAHFEEAALLADQNTIYLRQVADLQQRMGGLKEAAATFMKIGEKHLSLRRLADAIENWVLATRYDPDLFEAHERLAKVYENQGRAWLAVNEFLEVARIYENQGQLNRSLRACERAVKIDPRNAEALTAVELLKRGERAFPNNSRGQQTDKIATSSLSRFSNLNNFEKSQAEIQVVTPVAEKLQAAREQLAEDIFSAEVTTNTDSVNLMALTSQGLTDQTQGNNQEAIDSFVKAMDLGLRTPAMLFIVAHLYQCLNLFGEAIPLLSEIDDHPDYELVRLYGLGECLRGLGHIDKAIKYYVDALIYLDIPTVSADKQDRLHQQYAELLEVLTGEAAVDQATSFALSFGRFLQPPKWQESVLDARRRLDRLSTEPGSMILGDILNAGSSRILESLQLAQEHAEKGLYDSAIEEIYRAIEVSAGYLPAHIQMAELLILQNKLPQAAQKLNVIGSTFLVRGDKSGAIGALRRAVSVMPMDLDFRHTLVDLLREENRSSELIEQYLAMGDACYHMARSDDARQYYVEGLKLAQRTKIAPELRIKLLRSFGDLEMQRLDWKRALPVWLELNQLQPGDNQVAKNIVNLLFNLNETSKAMKQLDQLLVKLIQEKKGREVLDLLEDLIAHRPDEPGLVDRLARLYVRQKRKDKAIALLDKLGETLLEKGQNQLAVRTIQKILSLQPPNPEAYHQLLQQFKTL
ncbi:MAG: tetratricopeptide (TPR) repeat protein [Candidatus Promineifilaceae bacterium]|jgi:tetratricopeptide (TPR) repeat protein